MSPWFLSDTKAQQPALQKGDAEKKTQQIHRGDSQPPAAPAQRGIARLPDVLLAKGTHKILDLQLSEMFVVILYQLGIDSGHCHEDTDTGSFGA